MNITCAVCGTAFEGRRTARYCSKKCFKEARAQYAKDYDKANRAKRREQSRGYAAKRRAKSKPVKPELSREDKEKMVLMYYNGHSMKDISKDILGKASATKTVKKALLEFNVIKLSSRRILGWHSVDWSKSSAEIAEEMGLHSTTVSKRRRIYAPETIKKPAEEEDRECKGCGATFKALPHHRKKYCKRSCAREGRKIAKAKRDRIVKMYQDGYGMKHIAGMILGSASAKTTVRDTLCRAGVELRSDIDGKKISRHPNAKGGIYSLEIKRKTKNLRNLDSKLELPLFSFGSKEMEKKRKKESSKRSTDLANERARSMGYRSYYQMRYKTEPEFRLKEIYKSRFNKFVASGSSASISKLIGCTRKQFRLWIESQWEDWMTWDNIGPPREGYWQIDHVVPCSWFNHSDPAHLKLCWNYQNMRPLCAVQNMLAKNHGVDCITHLERMRQTEIRDDLIQFANEREWLSICY